MQPASRVAPGIVVLALFLGLIGQLTFAGVSVAQITPVPQTPLPQGPVSQPYSPFKQGGFEKPDLGTGSGAWAYAPTGSAWKFTGTSGLAGDGSAITVNNPPAPGRDQVGFVEGAGVIRQQIAVAAGRYRLTLKAAQRDRGASIDDQTVSVRLDGQEIDQIQPASDTYADFVTHSFVIGTGFHTLSFVGLDPAGGGDTMLLDKVKLQKLSVVAEAWSNPNTWPTGVPGPTDDVVIPAGQTVLLDTAAQARSLTIQGELYCGDKTISLATDWVMVSGRFECGSAVSPFSGDLTLTLIDATPGEDVMGMGDKVLGVMGGGVVELHGAPRMAWTQLSGTAIATSTSLNVVDPVDWKHGDLIVIAPTHEAYDEGEVVTVDSVVGQTVHFNPGLAHDHYGLQSTYQNASTSWTLDERAEVGLLSRNITIEGDMASSTSGFGGHMMSMFGSTVHASGIELHRMGQKGILGRYPFHWHLVQNAPGQYITNSSIHESFNRCVTVHQTHDTLVADNVCYDFIGHGYFLEDGVEENNTFDHNLGIWAKKPAQGEEILESDLRVGTASNGPAIFWISHPNNTFTRNAAAGSEGTGYWYSMDAQASGALPFGAFDDNRAHSSRQGFSSCRDAGGPWGLLTTNEALFTNLTATNNEQGVWPCSNPQTKENHRFDHLIVANAQNGMQAPNPMIFENSVFIAYTANAPSGALTGGGVNWRGVQVYDQGFLFENVHFVNYDRAAMTPFYPGGGAHKHANNRVLDLTFDNSPNLFLDPNNVSQVGNGPASWGDVLHVLDGNYTDVDYSIVPDHPLMSDEECEQPGDGSIAGYTCPHRYAHFRAEHFMAEIIPVTIVRSDGTYNTSGHTPSRNVNEFILDDKYFYSYRYVNGLKYTKVDVHLRNAFAGDTTVHELLDVPSTFDVTTSGWSPAADLRALFDGPGRQYFYRDHSLFLKLEASGNPWHAVDIVQVCMSQGCGGPNFGTPPSVAITSPADGVRLPAGAISVTASLSDPDGIASATLYLGLQRKGTKTAPPYTWTMNNVPAGDYPLKLVVEDNLGQSYTEVQQLFVGEPAPRVEITSITDGMTFDGPFTLAFDVHNWTVGAGGTHLRWLLDNVDQGPLFTIAPITVPALGQGRHEIRVALAEADGTIRAVNDTVVVYGVQNGVLADYEDGIDSRSSLVPKDIFMGDVRPIAFAWGTADPVASRADNQDDINWYDIGNNGDGTLSEAIYRLDLNPSQDWSAQSQLRVTADNQLTFDCYVVDANQGATFLGSRTGNVTLLDLTALASGLIDEVLAVELRYPEGSIPAGQFERQHLREIALLP